MIPALRLLEEWTTHQDYFWFLAVLAWGAVMGASIPRGESARLTVPGWMTAFAAACATGAVFELVLLAQHLQMPYTRLDAAMGLAQAIGTGALVWGATTGWHGKTAWRVSAAGVLFALAAVRIFFPLEAGVALAIVHMAAVGALCRMHRQEISIPVALLVGVLPVVATHGPLAYAVLEGRRTTDWSHFALLAATVSMAGGVTIATRAWRLHLQEFARGEHASGTLWRDLRRAVVYLALWLIGGALLAVGYGRIARRAFEENLLRRVETAVLALDEKALVEALGPELRITEIEHQRYPDGRPVAVATVPQTEAPVYATLRAQMARVRENNPDFKFLYVATWRRGHMLVLNSLPRPPGAITHVIHHDITPGDLERLAAGTSFLEGPMTSEGWLPQFSAKAVLRHPQTHQLLGWLVADVAATRWMTTFIQARLQTMALVGAGVGLWIFAVAHRIRREARDAAMAKAAAAAAADRMKSAFLAKVSHELRTPIQSVLGYGELLDGAALTEAQRGWLTALRSHGDIMLRLVNDLIDLGALQSGAFQLETGPVHVRALVDECATALRPAADAKGLNFVTEVAPGVPTWVEADGVRLRQILLNLLNNAVKFTSAGRVRLSVTSAGTDLQFVVSDTGPGIPAALRPRLFQPFARLDPAAGGGSGLGLALVQGICAAMRGSVRLDEGGAAGATFVVRLPVSACDAPNAAVVEPEAPIPSLRGRRILIAEDNSLVRELLRAFLSENGSDVILASDGATALAIAREQSPDVVLLDIALPEMDGISVARALREERRTMKIIGLSAHVGPQEEARARRAGMDMFLAKPVRLAKLAEAIIATTSPAPSTELGQQIKDERLRAKLLSQFADETPRVLADLRIALAARDWQQLRGRAHYLKNSADVLGATALQTACARVASLADVPAPDAARELVEAIEAAMPLPLTSVGVSSADKN